MIPPHQILDLAVNQTDNPSGETTSHSILSQHGLAPPLLARFQNGLLYRFIRGQPCMSSDLRKEPVWRGVAQKIAQWHARLPVVADGRTAAIKDSVVVPLAQSPSSTPGQLDKINAISPRKPVPNVWTVMQKWIFALPHKTHAEIERRDNLQRELERSVAELGSTKGLGGNGVRLPLRYHVTVV